MANVEARIKAKGKQYEISVDLDAALKFKAGKGDVMSALQSNQIYYNIKEGNIASGKDLMEAFGTTDVYEIAKKIMLSGEVQKNQEFRDDEREKKIKQVVNLIVRNASDQHGRPYTEERIKTAIHDAHYSFDSRPVEKQMTDIINKLKEIIPIKIETKKIKLKVPARFTGQAYGMLLEYKESEEWLSNGDLEVVMNIPAGLIIDFYDKINSITHGAVQSSEMK